QLWIEIAEIIEEHYQDYDGFIILHGTDTMAYTASALSFLLENLAKPVILTGAQLPVGSVRTDAHRNLVTSIQIAAAQQYGYPMVPEVCIYFDDVLLRGNRSRKLISNRFDAFHSENYPVLARAGIHVDFQSEYIREPVPGAKLKVHRSMQNQVAILKLFPGISEQMVACWLSQPNLKGLVLETFGSGNAPTDPWFLGLLEEALHRGVLVMNVSQCYGGQVEQGRYATSQDLDSLGVISGRDITPEAAITKLMYVLARDLSPAERKLQLAQNLRGEMKRINN
ncbi:MAG: type I asparaginase, partial [Bacteroidota bacterium]